MFNDTRYDAVFDRTFAGRQFAVKSIATGELLSKPTTFAAACNELEELTYASGAGNGLDITEVK